MFINLRKAFDTVDHGVLLGKLSAVGVIGPEHEWFTDYLRNRATVLEFHGVTNPRGCVYRGTSRVNSWSVVVHIACERSTGRGV